LQEENEKHTDRAHLVCCQSKQKKIDMIRGFFFFFFFRRTRHRSIKKQNREQM